MSGSSDAPIALAPTQSADATTSETQDGGERAAVAALALNQRIGDRYEIRGYLGEGGMGAVYRAFDEVLGEEVALKAVRGATADQAQLRDEVRVAQKVTHPNVCRTYDLEDIEGRHFVKMEYIAGETLAARIEARGALPIAEALRIARAVADGLAAAHTRGIIHRDLKPGNVMLSGERVVLMDFGLARAIETGPGDRAGTPSYMSPEQLAGKELDERSDLFALGCLVYEMLTGKRAFALPRVPGELPSVRTAPRWLARAVTELLALEPEHRRRGVRRLKSGPSRAWIGLVVVGVAVVALGVGWLVRPAPPWQPAMTQVLAHVGNADEPTISPDGKTVLFSADPGQRDMWAVFVMPLDGGEPRRVSPSDRYCGFARWSSDSRAALAMCVIDGTKRIWRLPLDGSAPTDLGMAGTTADACGDAIAVVSSDSLGDKLVVHEADGREILITTQKLISAPRCSRDGSHVLFVVPKTGLLGGALMISDRAGHVRELVPDGALGGAFTPGNRSIVYARRIGGATRLFETELATGKTNIVTPREEHAQAPDVSPDGKSLIFHHDVTWSPLYELGGASVAGELRTFQQEGFNELAPVPGGTQVVATRTDRDPRVIVAIDVASGKTRTLTEGEQPFIVDGGKRVMFRSLADPSALKSISIDGGAVADVARFPGKIFMGVDGPDGAHVLVAHGNEGEAWIVPRHSPPHVEGSTGLVYVAPDAGWRAIATRGDGKLRFVAPGEPLSHAAFERRFVGRGSWVNDHQFSYCDARGCQVFDVNTGSDGVSLPNPVKFEKIAASPDGQRWFFTPIIAQVTLHRVTNFSERAWKP